MSSNDPVHIGGTGGQREGKINEPAPTGNPTGQFVPVTIGHDVETDSNNGWQYSTTNRFKIKSAMDGGRVLYMSYQPEIGDHGVHTNQYRVFLRESEGNMAEFWYYNKEDQTVRSTANGEYCLDWDHVKSSIANGVHAVARPCSGNPSQKYIKENYHIQSLENSKFCLAAETNGNKEEAAAIWAKCKDK